MLVRLGDETDSIILKRRNLFRPFGLIREDINLPTDFPDFGIADQVTAA